MSNPSPLRTLHEQAEAAFLPYGDGVQLVDQFASVEIEYAAIRKSAALLDCPHRGLLRITGGDRLDFLHRLLSNDCANLQPDQVMRTFLLDANGRIAADLLLIGDASQTLVDVDVHQAQPVADELDKLLFGEDVQIENLTDRYHRLSLHGAQAIDDNVEGIVQYRYDELGVTGIHLWMTADQAQAFAAQLDTPDEKPRVRPIGWSAYNIARIEAGRVMFNIDFGPDSLPHETESDALAEAVSFTKGCYRGQEIVSRIESRSHPAKTLVGFRSDHEHLPTAGAPVLDGLDADAQTVGAVTSSTYSPMLGGAPIGFAMVKWDHHQVGTTLYTPTPAPAGTKAPITVHALRFH